jgi:hypothetical protein
MAVLDVALGLPDRSLLTKVTSYPFALRLRLKAFDDQGDELVPYAVDVVQLCQQPQVVGAARFKRAGPAAFGE